MSPLLLGSLASWPEIPRQPHLPSSCDQCPASDFNDSTFLPMSFTPSSYGNLLCWRHLCPDCAQTCAQNNAHPIADTDLPGAILLSLPLLCGVFTYLYLSICVFSCSPGPPTAETVHCPSIIRRAVMWLQLRALSQRPAARVSTFASFRQLWSISVAFCI